MLERVERQDEATKLINELGWRNYWQRLYAKLGNVIWQYQEPYKTGYTSVDYAQTLPDDTVAGTTGRVCIDIYECLLELPVVIRRGDVADEVVNFAKEHNRDLVITAESPSPRFKNIFKEIEHSIPVEVLAVEPFFEYDGYIDLKRFSRYWKVAERHLFG